MSDEPAMFPDTPQDTARNDAYRVLARKYRPADFESLIGQDALVRTLRNAIDSGRLAHAFMLTGVRGVGKTTTARIIARALNCIGPDGKGGPTTTPCGVCPNCTAIARDGHVDVIEMDAASRTGVDDVREIIEGVRYGPATARFKIWIIDEVHMLSRNAFNALLKTLEEPPEHVKFIFATTEIRKVPVTVLSRCQRFDLRRIDQDMLARHYTGICEKEGVTPHEEAINLIARAADGSARDGLSLLDQAIALGNGQLDIEQVRDMLGMADRTILVDLFEALMAGEPQGALDVAARLHAGGADPVVILQDLLELSHTLTTLKVAPKNASMALAEAERVRGAAMAEKLSVAELARTWQMLMKGLGEVQNAPSAWPALEMVLIRLTYAATLPAPAELAAQIRSGKVTAVIEGSMAGAAGAAASAPDLTAMAADGQAGDSEVQSTDPTSTQPTSTQPTSTQPTSAHTASPPSPSSGPALATNGNNALAPQEEHDAQPEPVAQATPQAAPATPPADPKDFRELVTLFRDRREPGLYGQLYSNVHLVRMEPGLLEIRLREAAPPDFSGRVGRALGEWTGRRWMVSISGAPGEPTLFEQDRAENDARMEAAKAHPGVRAVLEAFPGARITAISDLNDAGATPDPVAPVTDPEDTAGPGTHEP